MLKCCSTCESLKEEKLFVKRSSGTISSLCKECKSEYDKEYRYKNTIRDKLKKKEYILKTKNSKREYDKEYRKRNKNRIAKNKRNQVRKQLKEDPVYKIKMALRTRIRIALKGRSKIKSTQNAVGCDWLELKLHLEKQFAPNMTWLNYEHSQWHVDHIVPLNLAKTVEEVTLFNHYSNLRPLWAKDNIARPSNGQDLTWSLIKEIDPRIINILINQRHTSIKDAPNKCLFKEYL